MWLDLIRHVRRPYIPGIKEAAAPLIIVFVLGCIFLVFTEERPRNFEHVKAREVKRMAHELLAMNETDPDKIYMSLKELESRIHEAMKEKVITRTKRPLFVAHLLLGLDQLADNNLLTSLWLFAAYTSATVFVYVCYLASKAKAEGLLELERQFCFFDTFLLEDEPQEEKMELDHQGESKKMPKNIAPCAQKVLKHWSKSYVLVSVIPALIALFASMVWLMISVITVSSIKGIGFFDACEAFMNYSNGLSYTLEMKEEWKNYLMCALALVFRALHCLTVALLAGGFIGGFGVLFGMKQDPELP